MDYTEKAFVEQAVTKERPALQLSKKFSVFATSCARGATEAELVEAYNEVMAECDELSLLTSRAPLIALAQANDVRDTLECISEMKKQAKSLQEELDALLLDAEIRAQVAVLAAIPTRESLMQAYENETERDLRPIELQKAKVAKQVALHRKHLAVLQASIQQIEAELNLEHEFLDINSGAD